MGSGNNRSYNHPAAHNTIHKDKNAEPPPPTQYVPVPQQNTPTDGSSIGIWGGSRRITQGEEGERTSNVHQHESIGIPSPPPVHGAHTKTESFVRPQQMRTGPPDVKPSMTSFLSGSNWNEEATEIQGTVVSAPRSPPPALCLIPSPPGPNGASRNGRVQNTPRSSPSLSSSRSIFCSSPQTRAYNLSPSSFVFNHVTSSSTDLPRLVSFSPVAVVLADNVTQRCRTHSINIEEPTTHAPPLLLSTMSPTANGPVERQHAHPSTPPFHQWMTSLRDEDGSTTVSGSTAIVRFVPITPSSVLHFDQRASPRYGPPLVRWSKNNKQQHGKLVGNNGGRQIFKKKSTPGRGNLKGTSSVPKCRGF